MASVLIRATTYDIAIGDTYQVLECAGVQASTARTQSNVCDLLHVIVDASSGREITNAIGH